MTSSPSSSEEPDSSADWIEASGAATSPVGEPPKPWLGAQVMRALLIAPIRAYQLTLSRIMPPCCRFYPSCSRYTVEAIQVHGAVKGPLMGVLRILRCNPFSKGGYDPVPPRRQGAREKDKETTE